MRTRPVPQTIVAAAEDVEYLVLRAEEFINNHRRLGFLFNRNEVAYASVVAEYVSGAVRLATKQA
jgi:hypothetical protein